MTFGLERFVRRWWRSTINVTPARLEGQWLIFERMGPESYLVTSKRGAFEVGRIGVAPGHRAWAFYAREHTGLTLTMLAEVYAFLKGLGGRQI